MAQDVGLTGGGASASCDVGHSNGSFIGDEEWRNILTLAAYKWFVPCYVNQLPLPTLLLYWDRLLLGGRERDRRRAAPVEAGLSAAHLQLALALVRSAVLSAREAMAAARPEEGLARGFEMLLQGAHSQIDGPALIANTAHFEITPRQLQYLRTRLHLDESALKPRGTLPPQPALSGLQMAALRLMGRSEYLPLRVLQHTLLLQPPQPPPMATTSEWHLYFPFFVSTCTLTFAAFCLHLGRAVLAVGRHRE